MNKIIAVLLLLTVSSESFAWEAYGFKVSYLSALRSGPAASVCVIGMKELSPKSGNDDAICDTPTEIWFDDCSSSYAENMMALAMFAKANDLTMSHQALSQHGTSGACKVKPYNLRLED